MEEQNQLDALKRELRFTRAACIASSVLTAALLAVFIVGLVKVQPLLDSVREAEAVLDHLAAIDTDALNDAIEQFQDVDLQALADAVEELDMETVNGTMEQVGDALEDLDMEAVSTAIQNLNGAVEKLQAISSKLGSLFGANAR